MITRRLARAILKSPKFGVIDDLDEIAWIQRTVYVWPSRQPRTKIDIYVNDEKVMRCDLSFIRKIARG